MTHTNDERLVVFVKAPRPGKVKTRLAIGPDAACLAYRTLVETLLQNLQPLAGVELRYSPDDAHAEIEPWLQRAWVAQPQGDGDLGRRLLGAFDHAFATGAKRVVVIGSDCPAVTAEDIHTAWKELHSHDVALGPAGDGGYWLIGLRRSQPRLFYDIAWSTDRVFQQTRRRIHETGLSVHLMHELRDVDTVEDWLQFLTTRNQDGIIRPAR